MNQRARDTRGYSAHVIHVTRGYSILAYYHLLYILTYHKYKKSIKKYKTKEKS